MTRLFAAVCVALCALVVGACGSDGSSDRAASGSGASTASAAPKGAVAVALNRTFGSGAQAAQSGRIAASMRVSGKGIGPLAGPLSVRLSGPFDLERGGLPRFDVTARVQMAGKEFRSGAVSTGTAGYLRMRGRTFELPGDLFAQIRQGLAGQSAMPTLQTLGIDPRRWLTDARDEGTETLDGTPTTHLSGGIDVPRLLDDFDKLLGQAGQLGVLLPGQSVQRLSGAQRKHIADQVRNAKVDLWTGKDDRILRRLTTAVDLARGGGLDLRLDVSDVGKAQTIETPRDARPFTELLPGGLGALLGGGGGAKALECLQKAGSDATALQRCAQRGG